MFTASLQSIARNKLKISANVAFTEGAETIVRNYEFPAGTSDVEMKRTVKSDLDALNASAPGIPTGSIDFSGVNPTPTADEVARNAWITGVRRLSSADKLVKLGVLTGNEQQITNLRASVQGAFQQSYIDYI